MEQVKGHWSVKKSKQERWRIYFKYKKEKKKEWNQKSERKTDLYVPETVPCSSEIARLVARWGKSGQSIMAGSPCADLTKK